MIQKSLFYPIKWTEDVSMKIILKPQKLSKNE
jgi:hypothetical protein